MTGGSEAQERRTSVKCFPEQVTVPGTGERQNPTPLDNSGRQWRLRVGATPPALSVTGQRAPGHVICWHFSLPFCWTRSLGQKNHWKELQVLPVGIYRKGVCIYEIWVRCQQHLPQRNSVLYFFTCLLFEWVDFKVLFLLSVSIGGNAWPLWLALTYMLMNLVIQKKVQWAICLYSGISDKTQKWNF